MESSLVEVALFLSAFLILCSGALYLSERYGSLPYTGLLIVGGFLTQAAYRWLGSDPAFELSPDLIYFILLPILLFESAFHINFHQFRLQARTITFLSTFGLLTSVFTVGLLVSLTLDMPIGVALLFGAIISSTDPIAVIALFKQLGAPKRLGLLAEGESMFNDATGVIAFRIVSTFVVTGSALQGTLIAGSAVSFLYVFAGSLAVGSLAGWVGTKLLERAGDKHLIEVTVTLAIALFTFVAAEHFLHLSGVISAVAAGIVVGNLSRARLTSSSLKFLEHLWEYLAFVCISLVFYFASLTLDPAMFLSVLPSLPAVILAVLVGRSVSVYLSCWLSNRLRYFRSEPNVPLAWQHVLNWGGLRGVIPLVLAYSLPEDFADRELLISFTMATFLFTLLVNGATIRALMVRLGLHFPPRVERLYRDKNELIALEEKRQRILALPSYEFDRTLVEGLAGDLKQREEALIAAIAAGGTHDEIFRSLRLAGNAVERYHTGVLFEKGYMDENVLFAFESQLDNQQDRLQYPELPRRSTEYKLHAFETSTSLRHRVARVLGLAPTNRMLKVLFRREEREIVLERFSLLQVRLITSEEAVRFFQRLQTILSDIEVVSEALDAVLVEQQGYIAKNRSDMERLTLAYPHLLREHQERLLSSIAGEEA